MLYEKQGLLTIYSGNMEPFGSAFFVPPAGLHSMACIFGKSVTCRILAFKYENGREITVDGHRGERKLVVWQ
jgi:hypothetical protein